MDSAQNKTAIITGSTKGIGRAIALKLAQQSYNIVLNYFHDDTSAQEALSACGEKTANVILVQADLLSPEASYINGQKIIADGGQYMW